MKINEFGGPKVPPPQNLKNCSPEQFFIRESNSFWKPPKMVLWGFFGSMVYLFWDDSSLSSVLHKPLVPRPDKILTLRCPVVPELEVAPVQGLYMASLPPGTLPAPCHIHLLELALSAMQALERALGCWKQVQHM